MRYPQIIPSSDRTILVQFGDAISKNLHQQVFSFSQYLINHQSDDIINIHPAYSSVMITMSNGATLSKVTDYLYQCIDKLNIDKHSQPEPVEIPVVYGGEYGPDLERVSIHCGLTQDEVIKRHYKGNYLVYFIGFSIGFPYFGGMDDSISTPRLDSPRKSVPSGSIGIAGNQTGVYPLSSPGGWNLIGRTPLLPFNVKNPENSVIRMGGVVHFISISSDEFKELIP